MLQQMLDAARLDPERFAKLIGISPRVFKEWTSGKEPIPDAYLPMIASILGTDESVLKLSLKAAKHAETTVPMATVWHKFRGESLTDADRECVVLIREMAFFVNEFEEFSGAKNDRWQAIFDDLRREVATGASARVQGKTAAHLLRDRTSLAHGATGIGEVIRGFLRSLGMLVIEAPIKDSILEGCCFYVGQGAYKRPCLFANTHHTNWFRRNVILSHELAHAIFDADWAGASIDLTGGKGDEIQEERADAFAVEMLIPKQVFVNAVQRRGIKPNALTSKNLAALVADTGVDLRTFVKAAVEAGFIEPDMASKYADMNIWEHLLAITDHALSTDEYVKRYPDKAQLLFNKRTATIPPRAIRLPVWYVNLAVEAFKERRISRGKAARMLMIDEFEFVERFPDGLNTERELAAV